MGRKERRVHGLDYARACLKGEPARRLEKVGKLDVSLTDINQGFLSHLACIKNIYIKGKLIFPLGSISAGPLARSPLMNSG